MKLALTTTFLVLAGPFTAPPLSAPAARSSTEPALRTIDDPPWPDPELLAFFGKRNLDTIRNATRVDVFDLDNDPHRWRRPSAGDALGRLYGYVVRKARQGVPPDHAKEIQDAVLAPRFYMLGSLTPPDRDSSGVGFGRGKGCLFNPGAILRFTRGRSTTDVLLCFGCDDLGIRPWRSPGFRLARFDDIQNLDRVDISAGADAFKKLVERAFLAE
jgi:hypothetical protein